ncbi:MAG: type IV pilus twitching motility protein PilT [Candidatus Gastranaerophilaceae bacterium]
MATNTTSSKFNIIAFLKKAVAVGASDVHLQVDEHPVIRIDGKIIKVDMPILTDEDIAIAYDILLPAHFKGKVNSVFDLDFAYEIHGVSRFRVNLSRQLGKSALVIRTIPYNIKKVSELMLPESIEQFASLNNGLVLITGPTGSGKSTTIASLIDYININYQKHIITIEDPVEFIFTNRKCIVSQRQVLIDTPTFPDGIKYALRQDPDVIFIGEIRDKETVTAALKAAETGHLVFATIHTNDAIQTVNRIVNMFEPSDREFVRIQLASILRGTVSQKLVPLTNGAGRRPVCEVLVVTPTVKDFIAKDKLEEIYELVKKGSFNNMITMILHCINFMNKN